MDKNSIENLTLEELKKQAKELNIKSISSYKKAELIQEILKVEEESCLYSQDERYKNLKDPISNTFYMSGRIQVLPAGFAFLRNEEMTSVDEYVYISSSQVQKFKLNSNDTLTGRVRLPKEGESHRAMLFVERVNNKSTKDIVSEENKKLNMNTTSKDLSVYSHSHKGVLDVNPDGFGFIRTNNYITSENDIYVHKNHIHKYNLKTGDLVEGKIKLSSESERYDALSFVEKVNDLAPELMVKRKDFNKLTPIFPDKKYNLETKQSVTSTRLIDIFSPLGKGSRGLIVAAPKVGKTILLKEIAKAIEENHKEAYLIMLLIDERPEEVTDIKRSINSDCVYSTFDQTPKNHIKVCEIVLERAKRLVELDKDVIILMDSITRFTRANNLVVPPSGRTLSGGLDPESLYLPKKFFGAARNIEGGGSLTILATALVETGSRMDDVIFEEFKGTGNMELVLDRNLANKRIFPSIDITKSGSRREDLLLNSKELLANNLVRKSNLTSHDITEKVINLIKNTKDNQAFLNMLNENSKI